MTINPLAMSIRAKKLGVLIRNARLSTGKSAQECADAMGIALPEFEACELGGKSPSLPQVELLAHFLNIPVDHFWGNSALPGRDQSRKAVDVQRLIQLRQRMIGLLIRQSRLDAGLSLEQVAEKTGLSSSYISKAELGEVPVTLPELETVASVMGRPLRDFQDRQEPAVKGEMDKRMSQGLMEMPLELQAFVCKPVNRPYLELAQRLSEMSVEKLRAVAEGLLEITL